MALSQTALQGILASVTNVVYLECLTISHSALPGGTIRLINDRIDMIRNAGIYIAFPFTITGPHQAPGQAPELEIEMDMVDQQIITALRSLAGNREKVKIVYDVVISTAPNTVEWGPVEFSMTKASTDSLSKLKVSASFSLGLLEDAFPTKLFSPSNRSGL